jgi:gliding-associated putative ABC transporter substrate-binding component GldG
MTGPTFVPMELQTGLDDLFFKYGVRFEPGLIRDLQSSQFPLVVGQSGGQPQMELFNWPYHVLAVSASEHPTVKSLDQVDFQFPSKIDTTIQTKTNLKKTVLFSSSVNSNEQFIPIRLNFDAVHSVADPNLFRGGPYPLAVLVEGVFPSLYENRITAEMENGLASIGQEFKIRSDDNGKMLFVSDGDLAANVISDLENERVYPLGYNRYDKRQYANKDFLVNAIEYMMDDYGLIVSRGKELKLRLLNVQKARDEKTFWQSINLLLPLAFICVVGFAFFFWRKVNFSK